MTISEIRSMAKTKLGGTAIKCSISCLLYFFINLIFTYLLKLAHIHVPNFVGAILQLLFSIVSLPLGYGITANIIKLSDSKTNSVTGFLDEFILNFGKYIKLIFHEIIRLIVPILLCIISFLYLIGTLTAYINSKHFLCFFAELLPLAVIIFITTLIVLLYFLLDYSIISFIYYNTDKKEDSKQILDKSKDLMKGHKLDFIKLFISFIPYFIFVSIILVILGRYLTQEYLTPLVIVLYTVIKPHITVSKLLFTEELGNN